MKLYIAEKKEVASAMSDALGGAMKEGVYLLPNGDKITWLFGHLLRLIDPEETDAKYEKWALDELPMSWPIILQPQDRHEAHLNKVVALIKEADELVNAGDPDPEGQRLVDEVIEYADVHKPVWRILINDNNAPAIRKAIDAMESNDKYYGLSQSALARAVGDQRYGYNLTRVYTLLAQQQGYAGVLSVGRVQTPILGLVVRRDRQIESHQAMYYYLIDADLHLPENPVNQRAAVQITARYQPQEADPLDEKGRIIDRSFAEKITEAVSGQSLRVVTIETKQEDQSAPLPYNLLALQADAAAKYGLSPKEVLDITQNLRDKHKAITYNRSDCRYLNEDRHADAPAVLAALSARMEEKSSGTNTAAQADSSLKSKAFNDSKVTAHHAIIPTESVPAVAALSDKETQVYELICDLYIAQFYPSRVVEKSKAQFEVAGHIFTASASQEIRAGWRDAVHGNSEADDEDGEEAGNAQALASLIKDDTGTVNTAWVQDKQTQPPKRYTMSTLLKDLASVAKYVDDPRIKALLLDKDADKADEKGGIGTPATRDSHIETLFSRGYVKEEKKNIISTALGRQLIDALPSFATTPDMTALWHEKQKEIESGALTMEALLAEIDQAIRDEVGRVKNDGLQLTLDLPKCPNCEKGHLRQREGKNGKFWGCSAYPDCKTTFPDKDGKPDFNAKPKSQVQVSTEHLCPECGKGLVRRPSQKDKTKFWWGCSGYPQCTFTTFDNDGQPKL